MTLGVYFCLHLCLPMRESFAVDF